MTVQILNTRSSDPGYLPESLLEGQIFFNLVDRVMLVGDGSDTQTLIDGSTTPCPLGDGWFEVALTIPELDDYFLISPQHYGDIPTDGQFLQWDSTLNHSIWNDIPLSGGSSYQTTNSAVAVAPGATTSDKIANVLGVTPIEGDTVIVSGVSGDTYQGFYVFSGSVWNFAALYASPTATNVSFDNTGTTLSATEVQSALVELDTDVVAAQATADAALPKSGGTMTGPIVFDPGQSIPISGIPNASTSTKGIVQVGSNIDVSAGVISIPEATNSSLGVVQAGANVDVTAGVISILNSTTSQPGVVQLNDTTSSTSVTEALTANQGRNLQQQINALVISNNITLGGTIDGSTGLVVTTTPEGVLAGLVAGSPLPSPSSTNAEIFVIVSVTGTMTPPGGSPTLVHIGDWWLSNGTSWVLLDVGYQYPYASTTQQGVVYLATNAEAQAGVNTTNALVPSALQSKLSDSVSLTSSITIASSTAAKTAYDKGVAAQSTANQAVLDAAAAQADATQALSDAAAAQSTANQAVLDAAAAQSTADQAALDAAAAQATADAALPLAGGTMTGTINFVAGQTIPAGGIQDGTLTQKGVVQLNDSTSSTSNTEAATPSAVKSAYDAAAAAQTDATQALADAAAAQATADAAIPESVVAAKGDVLVGLSAGLASVLPVGSDNYILAANSSTTTGLEWISNAPAGVLLVSGTLPITVDNTDFQNPVIGINNATTLQSGSVQLASDSDTQSGTNATAAVTPASLQSKLSNSVATVSSTTIASSSAVKTAYDAAVAAQTTANNALPLAGGTMTGQIGLVSNQTISGGTY